MRFPTILGVLALLWSASVAQVAATWQPTSTRSGVFTEEQAGRGQSTYKRHCADCHGHDLTGDAVAPGLKGPEFMNHWSGQTVGELVDRIRVSMPPRKPDALTASERVDVVAYLLAEQGFSAGASELPHAEGALSGITIEPVQPRR